MNNTLGIRCDRPGCARIQKVPTLHPVGDGALYCDHCAARMPMCCAGKCGIKRVLRFEALINGQWHWVTYYIFRSWSGPRRVNGRGFNGRVFYLGTNMRTQGVMTNG